MLFHTDTHSPESEQSEEQPRVHGFVLYRPEKTPFHSLRHSWKIALTEIREQAFRLKVLVKNSQ